MGKQEKQEGVLKRVADIKAVTDCEVKAMGPFSFGIILYRVNEGLPCHANPSPSPPPPPPPPSPLHSAPRSSSYLHPSPPLPPPTTTPFLFPLPPPPHHVLLASLTLPSTLCLLDLTCWCRRYRRVRHQDRNRRRERLPHVADEHGDSLAAHLTGVPQGVSSRGHTDVD